MIASIGFLLLSVGTLHGQEYDFLGPQSEYGEQNHVEEGPSNQQYEQQYFSPVGNPNFVLYNPQNGIYPGFPEQKQIFPRLQPQVYLYGGVPGQPFLLNPGSPPGNFLVPQQPQQPGLPPGFDVPFGLNPQGPGAYPGGFSQKPTPPIEKDAEQIPTNPAKIPPHPSTSSSGGKPEKLETFTNTSPFEGESQPVVPRPLRPPPQTKTIRPGQKYFFLNGRELFSYPLQDITGRQPNLIQYPAGTLPPISKGLPPFNQYVQNKPKHNNNYEQTSQQFDQINYLNQYDNVFGQKIQLTSPQPQPNVYTIQNLVQTPHSDEFQSLPPNGLHFPLTQRYNRPSGDLNVRIVQNQIPTTAETFSENINGTSTVPEAQEAKKTTLEPIIVASIESTEESTTQDLNEAKNINAETLSTIDSVDSTTPRPTTVELQTSKIPPALLVKNQK